MRLLGTYPSSLQAFHYQELLDLYTQQIAIGGFAGTPAFDTSEITALVQASEDFTSLPLPSAGQRVDPDSINTPLNLLVARYNALTSEASAYESTTASLISILQKDTQQLDELLSAADLQVWISQQPQLSSSTKFSWSYGESTGPTGAAQISLSDPANAVVYSTNCPTNTYLDVVSGDKNTGMVAPSKDTLYPVRDMLWSWTKMTAGEQSEDIYGQDWAELNLLENAPIINFLPNPAVQTILPLGGSVSNVFSFGGQSINGSLPIYIQTSFFPRRNSVVLTPQNALSNGSFEAGATNWTFGNGWSLSSAGNAHNGSYYASKAFFSIWSGSISYVPGNNVSYLGKEYVCISSNINILPNLPNNTHWATTGVLVSQIFPLALLNEVYVEYWVRNIGANGIVEVQLVCLDQNGNALSPSVLLPGVSSADQYEQIKGVLQAIDNSSITSGYIAINVFGQTEGTWVVDDFRVHLPQNLSSYVVNQDSVAVFTPLPNSNLPQVVYFDNQDFVVDDISNVTFTDLPDGTAFTVRFTENYPAYQCSVNETVWSPLIMLDPIRPYPDNTTQFFPIIIGMGTDGTKTLFPVTDEQGVPTGLTMKVVGPLLFPYYLQITTPAQLQYGATAQLQIDFITPAYMNGLNLSPFSNYPIRLVNIQSESFSSDTIQTLGAPNALLDRPMVLTFPTTLISTIYLIVYQENYNLSTYQIQPPDQLQRGILNNLQTILPFNIQPPNQSVPVYYTGAQYTMGLERISGVNSTAILPGVFVAGPQHFQGCPDIFRFDASVINPSSIDEFNTYLCWIAYNASDVVVHSELEGISIDVGSCSVFPFPTPSILDRSTVDHIDIFLKFVFRTPDAVLQRYLLQVTAV